MAESRRRRISVRLDDKTDAQLRSVCQRRGLSQTETVKAGIAALAERLASNPYATRAQALALIRAITNKAPNGGKLRRHRKRDADS
jgi:hypothetical protein